MADIFEEIDEDLKQDQVYQWWKKNSKWLIPLLLLIVLLTGAFFWWQSYQQSKQSQAGAELREAVATIGEGDNASSKAALDDLISRGGATGMLAAFERAKLAKSEGDDATAVKVLQDIADNSSFDVTYRERAQFMALMQRMETEAPDALLSDFEALAAPGKTYRFSAMEMVGVLKAQKGDQDGAKQVLNELKELEGVPGSLRSRVDQLLSKLD